MKPVLSSSARSSSAPFSSARSSSARRSVGLWAVTVSAGFGLSCQLLYDKNDLSVATGGGGGTSSTATGGTTSTSQGGTGGTTTSASGGMGGTTTSTGSGGTGGTTTGGGGTGGSTTSMGGGGTGGSTTSMGGSGGGTTTSSTATECLTERLFAFGTGPNGIVCATSKDGASWTPGALDANGKASARPGAALISTTAGVGVFYQEGAGTPGKGPLRSVAWNDGVCGAPSDVLSVITKAGPSVTVEGTNVRALFQGAEGAGTDHPFLVTWTSPNLWANVDDVDVNVFSPSIAGLAANGSEMLATYGGGDDKLYRVFYSGSWMPGTTACFLDGGGACELANNAVSPAIVGLEAGRWLVVFHEKAVATQLRWLTGDEGVNVASKQLATALSASPVALARIPTGAVLAFRGTDDKVYTAVLDDVANTWGPLVSVPGAMTQTTPAVSAGVCTHTAELVYIDPTGALFGSSLVGGVWSAPLAVAPGITGLSGVALTSAP